MRTGYKWANLLQNLMPGNPLRYVGNDGTEIGPKSFGYFEKARQLRVDWSAIQLPCPVRTDLRACLFHSNKNTAGFSWCLVISVMELFLIWNCALEIFGSKEETKMQLPPFSRVRTEHALRLFTRQTSKNLEVTTERAQKGKEWFGGRSFSCWDKIKISASKVNVCWFNLKLVYVFDNDVTQCQISGTVISLETVS